MTALSWIGLGVTAFAAAIVVWLVRYDVARATIRQRGLPRYVAVCLFAGYGWLAVAGIGWLLGGAQTAGPLFDATTHAVFLGFVITMIMAHAPIILPAVLRVRFPYHPALYVPLVLLHASLAVRVFVSTAVGAWGNAAAIALFIATAAWLVLAFDPAQGARPASR